MKPVARIVALCAVACSTAALAVSPPPPKRAPHTISCTAAATPFFTRAWDALANAHEDDARALFAQTVAVDPLCTLGWAHLGALTPGLQGQKLLEDAVAVSAKLPEAERLQVLALNAQHRGDPEQALSLLRSSLVYAPRTWELEFSVAVRAASLQLWREAADAARRATELAPDEGAAWNLLGYAAVGLDDHAEAVKAFRQYAVVAPREPNAHDSLGDALLADGQLDEAEAAYRAALAASDGAFWPSNHGVATVCAMRGDWFCARAALEKARHTAPQASDRLALLEWTAWSFFADQQPGEAFKVLAELEQEARRVKLDERLAGAKLLEGRLLLLQGKHRAALTTFTALGGLKLPGLTEGQRQRIEAQRLHGVGEAFARLGNANEAERTLTQLRRHFEARPRDVRGNDAISHVRGLVALSRGDAAGAINAFMHCSEPFDLCRLDLATAQLRAGDPAAAARTHAFTRGHPHRDAAYWYVFVKSQPTARDDQRVW